MSSPTPPTLDALPSELRKLIVSHLAPSGDDCTRYARGGKIHLKNANLAHSCLREWVPEFLFRDMVLPHVLVGMSSQLERLTYSQPDGAELLKHVKTVQVKVPPAIRWEADTTELFDYVHDITDQRLTKKFGVQTPEQMTTEQRQYCSNYHRAMVEPFTDNRRWHKLLFCAMVTWRQVFPHLPNLEHIGVGFCGRTDHPAPTYTNTFVTRYGKWVHWDENSMFVEDASVNLAWASAIVLQTVTKTVKSLHLSMANSDNLSSFATVNRLLTNCYRLLASMPLKAITKLALDLRGPEGTHGDRNWTGRTGTAGMVGYWKAILAFMPSLAHLEIYGADQHPKYQFNDNEDSTDRKGCILDWLTTGAFYRIESLSLRSLLVNKDTIPKIFAEEIRNLKRLHVEEVRLMTILDIEGDEPPELPDTTRGLAWWELGQWLSQNMSDVDVHIDRPISDVNGESQWKLHRKYIDKLSKLPGVELDVGGYYYTAVFLDPYEEESNTKEEAHGN